MTDCINMPPRLDASNYTQLKKNRILYHQYQVANPEIVVCNKNKSQKIQYNSYHLKQSIEKGCWYNETYCNCACPSLHCDC